MPVPFVQPQRTVTCCPQHVGLSTRELKGHSVGLDTGTVYKEAIHMLEIIQLDSIDEEMLLIL